MAENRLNAEQEERLGQYKEVLWNWMNIFENDLRPTEAEFEMIERLTFVLKKMEICDTPNKLEECAYLFHEVDVQSRRCLNSVPRPPHVSHRR